MIRTLFPFLSCLESKRKKKLEKINIRCMTRNTVMAGGNQNHISFTSDEGRPPSPLGTLFLSGPFGLQVRRGLGPATSLTAFCFFSALELHPVFFLSGAEGDGGISWRLCGHRPAPTSALRAKRAESSLVCGEEWRPFTKMVYKTK